MALAPGTRLGPYEVTAQIGVGGMGEVYRATDTSLKRAVAIKVLPESVAGDAERLARFQREAEVLASLNHPNIAAIYGLERSGGTSALVMELIEGLTLADRIAQGAIPVDEALPIAKQIAEALEAAHEQGIIHRDLKPANIKLRPDGTVKVLDFGLAKLVETPGSGLQASDLSRSPTITSPAGMTGVGMLLGTAAYMSPEQARGKVVDKRADIWAFGCALYEVLTGRAAFRGDTVTETIAAVLEREPDWNALPATTSPALRRLLHRCLEKDQKRRLRDIGDARVEIDELASRPTALQVSSAKIHEERAPAMQAGRPGRAALAWAVAGLATLSALLLAAFGVPWRSVETRQYRVGIVPPRETIVEAGSAPQISPDGSQVAFVGADASSTNYIYVRALDALTTQMLAGTAGATQPFWAPDSRRIGFFADGKLKTLAIGGGAPRTLADAPVPRGGTWNADDLIVFVPAPPSGPFLISAAGGAPTPIEAADEAPQGRDARWFPALLPDGRHFLYLNVRIPDRNASEIFVGSIDSTEVRRLMVSGSSVLYAAGHLLVRQESALMAFPFDTNRLEVTGPAVPVADSVAANEVTYQTLASASSSGVLTYLDARARSQLVWMDRAGRVVGEAAPPGDYGSVCLSASGRRLVFDRAEGGNIDIWTVDVGRAAITRLTFDSSVDFYPACSPTAPDPVFSSLRQGNPTIYSIDPTVPGSEQLILQTPAPTLPHQVSVDARFLVYSALELRTGWDLWVLPLFGDRKPMSFAASPSDDVNGRLSPDGRWMAYTSNEGGSYEVFVRPFPPASGRWQISKSGGHQPQWRGDGRELFFLSPDQRLMAAAVQSTPSSFVAGEPVPLFPVAVTPWESLNQGTQYAATPDGQRFVVNRKRAEAAALPITAVINWTTGLQR